MVYGVFKLSDTDPATPTHTGVPEAPGENGREKQKSKSKSKLNNRKN